MPQFKGISMGDFNDLQNQINHGEIISKRNHKAFLTFTDDDGNALFKSIWYPILLAKGIKMTCCPIVGNINTTVSWLSSIDIANMEENVEFVPHSISHVEYTTYTEEQLITDFEECIAKFKLLGYTHDVIAYPGGANNALVRKIGRRYFRAGLGGGTSVAGHNVSPVQSFDIRRIPLINGTVENTISYACTKIDAAIAAGGWLIFYTHSQDAALTPEMLTAIGTIIDYAITAGIEIGTISEGLDIYGNVFDIGDYPLGDSLVIGCDGLMYGSGIGVNPINGKYSFYSPITEFPIYNVTVSWVGAGTSVSFPYGASGLLTTYRLAGDTMDRQEFRPVSKPNEVWSRLMPATGPLPYFKPLSGDLSGTWANRPDNDNNIGTRYFNTDTGKPIFVKTAGVKEVDTYTVTAGATISGNITVQNYTVAVTAGMTAIEVATAIRNTIMTGYKLSGTAGTAIVYITRVIAAICSAPTFVDTGGTGVTCTIARTAVGAATVWVDSAGIVVTA